MVTAMSKPPLDPNTLAQFTDSERVFRHSLVRGIICTEGVKYVLDIAEAYCLLSERMLHLVGQLPPAPLNKEDGSPFINAEGRFVG